MKRSSVINYDGTINDTDSIRTSYGCWIQPKEDKVIADIEDRMAKWTHLPVEHAEAMQVLRYELGQKYGGHHDELDPTNDPRTVGGGPPRVATVLMYLSDVEEGGETAFPHSTWIDKDIQTAGKNFSDCTEGGVAVKPKRGDALLFWGLKPNLRHLDYPSMHTGCPVIKGVKWSATKWIHTQPLQGNLMSRLAAAAKARAERQPPCQNNEPECEEWALDGECEKNAEFMNRECAKSCKACCLPGDLLCLRSRIRQRNAAGMAVNTNR